MSPLKGRGWMVACVPIALATLVLVAPTAGARQKRHPSPLYWGGQIGKQLTGEAAPWDMGAIDAFERLARKRVSIVSFASPFADCSNRPCTDFPFPAQAMEALRERGIIPQLTWASQSVPTPLDLNEPRYRLDAIARGSQDAYIREFARQAKEWGHPFFLRFNHEMNGFWFLWSEGVNRNGKRSFVRAWRHVHDVFEEVGATNVTWVWCPNVDFTRKLTPLHRLYPGGRYVDWTCLDGFNWGDTPNSGGWMSFWGVFRETYLRVLKMARNKPVMIGEVASEERGGSKPRWIRKALRVIPARFRRVRAMLWFNEKDRGMRWPIASSSRSRNSFRRAIRRNVYRPNEFGEIEQNPIRPPTWR